MQGEGAKDDGVLDCKRDLNRELGGEDAFDALEEGGCLRDSLHEYMARYDIVHVYEELAQDKLECFSLFALTFAHETEGEH